MGDKILLVEDDELLRVALARLLSSKGYDVAQAEDGQAAMDELRRIRYDLLVTDMMMPRMSGEELLDRLETLPHDERPSVIVLTAHKNVDSAIKGIKTGVSAYIAKPPNMQELDAEIRSALDRRRYDREIKLYYQELDRKVEERTRELALLNSFTSLVNQSFDLDAILADAVENLAVSLGTDAAWIYLMEGEPPLLKLKASKGLSDALIEAASVVDPADGYSGRTFKQGGAFIYDDLDSVRIPLGKDVKNDGFKNALHAAIKSRDTVFGSMGVASLDSKGFQPSDLQILTSFGNQIGVAIDRINLYNQQKSMAEDLEKKVNQLVILNEMGHLIRVSNRVGDAAMVVVSAIVQGIGFDRVCLWLFDEDGKSLSLAACHGMGEGMLGQTLTLEESRVMSLPLEAGDAFMASGSVCDLSVSVSGKGPSDVILAPLVTRNPENKDIRCWEHYNCGTESCPAYKNPALTCWIIKDSCKRCLEDSRTLLDKMMVCRECPVYKSNRRGKTIGILCADNKASGRPVTQDEMNALNVFAGSAAAIVENITLMERLIKNERFIDSIIFNMSSGLMVTDRMGRVRMVNYAGAEILKCEREDLLGKDFASAFPEARQFLVVEDVPAFGREVLINNGGGTTPVGYSNSYLIEHDGESDGVIVVFRDLSEIKRLHEQLRERDRFAAIGKVAAGVAHEIRNPLFGITSVAQILAREVKDGTPKKALIDAMLSETSRLNTLVEDMLLYGRTMKVAPQPVDLNTLIESVLDFHVTGIREKELKVVRDFAPDLPVLMLDPHQMRQVFLNILVNTLDASLHGGEVRLRTRKLHEAVSVGISDNGVGIPEDDLPKVFDLFYTTKEKGTGLGLAICRKIVEDHGGAVNIHSLPGRGTTVEIVLPGQGPA